MKKKLKLALGFVILAATIAAFAHYLTTHPEIVRQLGDTDPLLAAGLLGLYILWFLALVVILRASIRLFGKTMPRQENLLLNAYSSLSNFFLPGQSGPAVRALYLKKRVGLRIKDYIFATLLYYGAYAIVSAFFLVVGSRPWWQTVLVVLAAGIGSTLLIRWYGKRSAVKGEGMNLRALAIIFLATAAQTILQLCIFYIELKSVNPGTSFAQALTYTGAANFALFVSLTPGAIGIREAFLVFSQGLHGLSNAVIVAANVIDRSIYLVFLGVLFVLTISLHAKDKLQIKRLEPDEASKTT
jgi:uncharacterized membrane protein YbhN (UPF0104 family)